MSEAGALVWLRDLPDPEIVKFRNAKMCQEMHFFGPVGPVLCTCYYYAGRPCAGQTLHLRQARLKQWVAVTPPPPSHRLEGQ